MANIVTIRDWFETLIAGLTPETRPGAGFEVSGTDEQAEPLDLMPTTEGFHRSFRVTSNRDFRSTESYLPLEREGSFTISVGYTGHQSDREIEDIIDEDEELIARNLISIRQDRPASLLNYDYQGTTTEDIGGGGGDVVIARHTYTVHYQCEAV